MFCPSCGNQVKDGSSFCPKCGAPIRNAVPEAGKRKARPSISPILLGVVAVAVVAILCIKLVPLIFGSASGKGDSADVVAVETEVTGSTDASDDSQRPEQDGETTGASTGSGMISRSIWDTSSITFSDSTIERDAYGKLFVRTTATNDSDVRAVFRVGVNLHLVDLSDNFKRQMDLNPDSIKTECGFEVRRVVKEGGKSLAIDNETLLLEPHESAQVLLFGYVPADSLYLDGLSEHGLVYGTDYKLAIGGVAASGWGSVDNYYDLNGNKFMNEETGADNESLFKGCLDDVSCELVSSSVEPTKEAGEVETTAVIRVRNVGDSKRAVLLRLGCFDAEGNYLITDEGDLNGGDYGTAEVFGVSQNSPENGVVGWSTRNDSPGLTVEVTSGEGGRYWQPFKSHTYVYAFGGEVSANSEIEVTVKGTLNTISLDGSLSGNESIRLLSMMPITKDLELESLNVYKTINES